MIQNINLGSAPNDKTGDKARVAGGKINGNFAYLEGLINNQTYLEAETGFALVGQNLTINAFWQWVISGIDYTNPSAVIISIPFAAAGKSRIDLIVCNSSNTFSRIAGEESLSTPNAPAVPLNTILATFFTVSDGSIGTIATPKPKAPVLSVNGKKGDVILGIADIADYNEKFKGVYLTLAALNVVHPTATAGDYAQVNETGSTDVVNYSWDSEESIWVNNGTGGSGATNTDALPEGSTNLYHTSARVLAALLTGISFVTGGAIVSTDSVLVAFGKLQKQITDVLTAIGLKQDTLVSGTNIKTINGTSVLGSGDITISGGGGDMVLASSQTVSGLKTFLSGMFGLRNIANTFTSFFTNANTASRTYTLQNRDGTLADLADIASVNTNKMNVPTGGIANYLPKFLTTTTIGLSRLWDTGTFFGIGTLNTPTKDFTLGNQANREIGIEESTNTVVGRDLIIKAGRTINYVPNSNFNALNQTTRNWYGGCVAPNGDVYACVSNGDIYKQTGGTGNFVALGGTARDWKQMCATSSGNIYATVFGGDIYKQTGGTGAFNALGQTARNWYGITEALNGNVYAANQGGDIYIQTAGVGNFVAIGGTSRSWYSLSAAPNGDIYSCIYSGDVYVQTGSSGAFNALGITSTWVAVAASPNGDIYASRYNGDVYKRTAGIGSFVALGQTSNDWRGLSFAPNGNCYGFVNVGDIYIQYNDVTGASNLDGGTLKQVAGTGKGTGKSRYEIWTGQKTASGTNMQAETLREYIDENGYHIYVSIPSYANDAAADADTNLPSGASYKLTGNRTIFHKP